MAPPNKILLPNPDPMGDVTRRLLALETAGSKPDIWGPYSESVDASHPFYLDFLIPAGVQPSIAKVSFKLRLYRTTSSFAGGTTGSDASSESGHSHSHNHSLLPQNIAGAGTMAWNNASPGILAVTNLAPNADTTSIQGNAAGSSGHSHSHAHSVGASSLGVSEGTATTVSTLLIDGVDKTSTLGGPWLVDQVDLDISNVLPVGDGLWHVIQLTPASLGRIVAELKLAA